MKTILIIASIAAVFVPAIRKIIKRSRRNKGMLRGDWPIRCQAYKWELRVKRMGL